MDRHYIKRHQIIEKFLLQQLTEEELDTFLVYQMMHPEILEEINAMREMIGIVKNFKPNNPIPEASRSYRKLLAWSLLGFALFIMVSWLVWIKLNPSTKDTATPFYEDKSTLTPTPPDIPDQQKSDLPIAEVDSAANQQTPPLTKNKQERKQLAVQFSPNKYLETKLNTRYRSEGVQLQISQPAAEADFAFRPEGIDLDFSGTINNFGNLKEAPFNLLLFNNMESDYLEFHPILNEKLSFREVNDSLLAFTLSKQIKLNQGLYYYLIEEENSGKVYFTGKFTIRK